MLEAEHGVHAGAAWGLGRSLSERRRRNRGRRNDRRRGRRLLDPRLMRGGRRSRNTGSGDARGRSARLGTKLLKVGEIARLFRARLNGGK